MAEAGNCRRFRRTGAIAQGIKRKDSGMDLIEPISFTFGVIVAVTACYAVSDLVFSKETKHEGDEE